MATQRLQRPRDQVGWDMLVPGRKPTGLVQPKLNSIRRGLRGGFVLDGKLTNYAYGQAAAALNGAPQHNYDGVLITSTSNTAYIRLNNYSNALADGGTWSITFRYRWNGQSGNAYARYISTAAGEDLLLRNGVNNAFLLAGTQIINTVNVEDQRLHIITLTASGFDGGGTGTARLYIDGSLQGSASFSSAIFDINDQSYITLGNRPAGSRQQPGWYDNVLLHDRVLDAAEVAQIARDPFGGVWRSANDTPYLFPVAGGGGVSGTGDLVGAGSQVVGTGTRSVTGTGALEGQGAEVVGTATRTITGTGALVGQGSDVAGTGAAGGTHTGTGDLVGAGSEIVGVGERAVTGTGALVAQGSAVAGVGERTVTGSGDLVGAGAEVSGSGAIGGITTGTGDLVGAGSEIVGTGLRTVTGSGALVAQGSAVTGTGERAVTGAGALVGSGSEIVGEGVGGDVTTGAGALVGQGSAVTGTGTRTITGVGELVAAGSIIVGSGLRTITGSGALVGAGSEIVGSYTEEDCTDVPIYTQFDEPVNSLHEAILLQFGEEVTFSGIGLTATAVFKRYKDDVPGGGARPGVPRDVLRIKQTDICAYDVDQGTAVTVRGQAYKVISVERTKHGMTNLGIRRTH